MLGTIHYRNNILSFWRPELLARGPWNVPFLPPTACRRNFKHSTLETNFYTKQKYLNTKTKTLKFQKVNRITVVLTTLQPERFELHITKVSDSTLVLWFSGPHVENWYQRTHGADFNHVYKSENGRQWIQGVKNDMRRIGNDRKLSLWQNTFQ